MKKRRLYSVLLLFVSFIMLAASIVPHHHHLYDSICLKSDLTDCNLCEECSECNCSEEHSDVSNHNHDACTDCCITKFKIVKSIKIIDTVSPSYYLISVIYPLFDVLNNEYVVSKSYLEHRSIYLEKLHSSIIAEAKGLRAPPYILA